MPVPKSMPLFYALAQQSSSMSRTMEMVFWLLAIVVAAVAVGAIGMVVRRRLIASEDEQPAQPFTLAELRRLHTQGQLSDEEYARAKAHMIAQARAAMQRDVPVDPPMDDASDVPPRHETDENDDADH